MQGGGDGGSLVASTGDAPQPHTELTGDMLLAIVSRVLLARADAAHGDVAANADALTQLDILPDLRSDADKAACGDERQRAQHAQHVQHAAVAPHLPTDGRQTAAALEPPPQTAAAAAGCVEADAPLQLPLAHRSAAEAPQHMRQAHAQYETHATYAARLREGELARVVKQARFERAIQTLEAAHRWGWGEDHPTVQLATEVLQSTLEI